MQREREEKKTENYPFRRSGDEETRDGSERLREGGGAKAAEQFHTKKQLKPRNREADGQMGWGVTIEQTLVII
jgi:hypothetical protein